MAKKKPATSDSATKVTRIKANDSAPAKKPTRAKTNTSKPTKATKSTAKPAARRFSLGRTRSESGEPRQRRNFLGPVGRYIAGSWYELRQVRWPDRRSTWSMTGALLAFTAFFIVVILLLDAGFKYLFQLILG